MLCIEILAERGAIDVGAVGFIADHQALGSHDLEHLENSGVAGGAILIESIVNLAHSGRLLLPEDLEKFEFGFGGPGDDRAVFHDE